MKNGNEGRDVLGDSRKRYREIRTALRNNKIVAFVLVPSEKKINGNINKSFVLSLFCFCFLFCFFFFKQYIKVDKFTKRQLVVGLLPKVNPCIIMQNVSAILLSQYTSALSF